MEKQMIRCYECRGKAEVIQGDLHGIRYDLYRCTKCGEEFLDMKQLKALGEKHKKVADAYHAKVSRWGNSIAARIPSDLVREFGLKPGRRIHFLKEKDGIKIIPA